MIAIRQSVAARGITAPDEFDWELERRGPRFATERFAF